MAPSEVTNACYLYIHEVTGYRSWTAVNVTPSHSYGMSLVIQDHTVTQFYLSPDTSDHAPP